MDTNQFFSNFTSTESLALLISWVLTLFLGILIGSLMRSGTIRRLREELKARQNELTASQGEVTRLTDELQLREADLRKAQFEVEEQRSKANRVTEEKTKLYNEIYSLNNQLEKLQKNGVNDAPAVADLNATIDGLQEEITILQNRNQKLEEELNQWRNAQPDSDAVPQVPEQQSFDYLADFQSTQNALRARLETLEEKLNRLETEKDELHNEMQALRTADNLAQPALMERAMATVALEEEPAWNLGSRDIPRQPIFLTEQVEQDDLTRIDGIGPFLEKQLNEIGIYTYEQIGHWDGSDIHQITQQIRYFPGRIERENWIGQAIRLYQHKQENPESYSAGNDYPSDHRDLKIVEGIGPKIEALLRDAGINTWEELAEADPDKLDEILDAAGNDYSFHNPATWTAQARLAAGGHWELLKEYQQQLQGGRKSQ